MSELKACERVFDVAIEVFEFDELEVDIGTSTPVSATPVYMKDRAW